ncbi:hypothetical protein ACFSCX_11575 [Bacillus salitolerans]|uniref:Uncharacterized protein n=1 Tax=Bacillus salitolerans TaxID=1437434 RepID=A0ABW4LQ40_9BACI
MSEIDVTMTIYVIFLIVATFISFKYGSTMIRKTGLFLPHALIAGAINLALGLFAIVGWYFFAWSVNEFLFFGGLVLGIGLLVVGEAALITILCIKRKKWIQIYK